MNDIWAARGLSRESFAISVGEMSDDPQFSRLCILTESGLWRYLELDTTIVSIEALPLRRSDAYLAALGIDGAVHFVGESLTVEQIVGAGVGGDDEESGFGSMSEIKSFGDILLACGNGSQVYLREQSSWRRVADPEISGLGESSFRSVAMNNNAAIAAGGFSDPVYRVLTEEEEAELERISEQGTMREYLAARAKFTVLQRPSHGCLFVNSGETWNEIELPGSSYINAVAALPDGRFLAAGGGGLLVCGGMDGNFEDYSQPGMSETFHDIGLRGTDIHLLTDTEVVVVDTNLYPTGMISLPEKLNSPISIDVLSSGIWYFDHRGVAWHDGKDWQLLELPDSVWEN